MTQIEAFLRRAARRAARRVSLDEALLTDRAFSYVWHRNRFLLLRVPLGLSLHAAEIIAFSEAYDLGIIGPMLAIRSLPAVAGALWWGALEELRSRVRTAVAKAHFGRAERAVRSFLGLGVDVALGGVALAVAYTQFWPSELHGFDVFDAYALACSLRFGLEVLARTYHAGIFAVRRVYRPLWSLVLADIAEVALALALWPTLGPWGFSLSLLCAGALGAGLQTHYVARAYRDHGLFRPRLGGVGRARQDIEPRNFGALGRHALANLTTHLDALLILLLSGVTGSGGLPFVVLLHALRPLLAAVSSYAGVFYFDFTRLSLGSLRFFERRFARVVSRFAWRLALLVSALAVALDSLVFRGQLRLELFLLVAYTFARSLLSVEQLRAFTSARYELLAKGALGALATLLCLRIALPRELPLVCALVLTLFVLALWLGRLNARHSQQRPVAGESVGFLRWLALLAREPARVRLGCAELDPRLHAPVHAVASALQAGSTGVVTARVGRRGLVWYERSPELATESVRMRLLAASAGCLESLSVGEPFELGQRAVGAALQLPVVAASASAASREPASTLVQLSARFSRDFPEGEALELTQSPRAGWRGDRTRARATVQVITGICLGKPSTHRDRSLPRAAVYCPEGEPEVVFLAPPQVDGARFRAFAVEVSRASLAATLAKTDRV